MKIGVLSQWFPPEAASLVSSLCEGLVARGHTVKALTGFPNYPDGEIYDGYRQRWGHYELHDQVHVRRVPLYPSHDSNAARRAANYLTFAGSSTLACGFLADCDVVYVYATPMSAAVAAAVLRRVRGRPYVLHVQDLWPDSVIESQMVGASWTRRAVTGVLNAGLRLLYRDAAHVIAIAPTMQRVLHERGVRPDKTSVVLNWSPEESCRPTAADPVVRAALGRPDRTIAVFAGNVGTVQDVHTIVRAASLRRHGASLDVAIIGTGTETGSVRRLVERIGADNVRVLDTVSTAEMAGIYASSDYQLVTLKDRPVFRATIPSKLCAALANGSPVITTVPGDVAEMCRSGGFGFSSPPEDVEALAATFDRACAASPTERQRMSAAALDFYRTRMSRASSIELVESILVAAAHGSAPGVRRRS